MGPPTPLSPLPTTLTADPDSYLESMPRQEALLSLLGHARMSPSERASMQIQLPIRPSTPLLLEHVGDESENTATSGVVIPMDPANAGEMLKVEMSTDISAPSIPEANPIDLDSPRQSATKQAIFILIQNLYTLTSIQDAETLASFLPFLVAVHQETSTLLQPKGIKIFSSSVVLGL